LATVGNEATARIRQRMRPFGLGAQQLLILRQLQAMGQSGQAERGSRRIWSTHHLAFSSCCGCPYGEQQSCHRNERTSLSIFVDEPAQSIDPHDPQVRCWRGQWDGHAR